MSPAKDDPRGRAGRVSDPSAATTPISRSSMIVRHGVLSTLLGSRSSTTAMRPRPASPSANLSGSARKGDSTRKLMLPVPGAMSPVASSIVIVTTAVRVSADGSS
jgi:hypothetical protein